MSNDFVFNILSTDAFLSVNKSISKKIGIIPAIVLSELISEQKYWTSRNELDSDGFFFSTIENIEDNCGIKRSQQDSAIEILLKENLLYKKVKGMPRKRFFKINTDTILKILMEKETYVPDLTKVRKNVRIFIEKFIEKYKEIDKQYFVFLNLKDIYKVSESDIQELDKLEDWQLELLIKCLNDINYTIDHSGAFENWREGMDLTIRILIKTKFRLNALLKFSEEIK